MQSQTTNFNVMMESNRTMHLDTKISYKSRASSAHSLRFKSSLSHHEIAMLQICYITQ